MILILIQECVYSYLRSWTLRYYRRSTCTSRSTGRSDQAPVSKRSDPRCWKRGGGPGDDRPTTERRSKITDHHITTSTSRPTPAERSCLDSIFTSFGDRQPCHVLRSLTLPRRQDALLPLLAPNAAIFLLPAPAHRPTDTICFSRRRRRPLYLPPPRMPMRV